MLLNCFCMNVMHLFIDRNKRPMSYLIENPTLQLDNCQMLSIEILFHTQHHIHKSTKELSHPQREKSQCHLVDKGSYYFFGVKNCITLYQHEVYNKTKVQLRNFYLCELVLAS